MTTSVCKCAAPKPCRHMTGFVRDSAAQGLFKPFGKPIPKQSTGEQLVDATTKLNVALAELAVCQGDLLSEDVSDAASDVIMAIGTLEMLLKRIRARVAPLSTTHPVFGTLDEALEKFDKAH